jgi:hypothetical protein
MSGGPFRRPVPLTRRPLPVPRRTPGRNTAAERTPPAHASAHQHDQAEQHPPPSSRLRQHHDLQSAIARDSIATDRGRSCAVSGPADDLVGEIGVGSRNATGSVPINAHSVVAARSPPSQSARPLKDRRPRQPTRPGAGPSMRQEHERRDDLNPVDRHRERMRRHPTSPCSRASSAMCEYEIPRRPQPTRSPSPRPPQRSTGPSRSSARPDRRRPAAPGLTQSERPPRHQRS